MAIPKVRSVQTPFRPQIIMCYFKFNKMVMRTTGSRIGSKSPWGPAPPPGRLNSYTQEIVITFSDGNNKLQTVSLGKINYTTVGLDENTWELNFND